MIYVMFPPEKYQNYGTIYRHKTWNAAMHRAMSLIDMTRHIKNPIRLVFIMGHGGKVYQILEGGKDTKPTINAHLARKRNKIWYYAKPYTSR